MEGPKDAPVYTTQDDSLAINKHENKSEKAPVNNTDDTANTKIPSTSVKKAIRKRVRRRREDDLIDMLEREEKRALKKRRLKKKEE